MKGSVAFIKKLATVQHTVNVLKSTCISFVWQRGG